MSVRCRLVRTDGSTWYIEELRDVEDGFRVDAVPNGSVSGRNGTPPSDSDGADGRLDDEPLVRGDRIEWVEDGGDVLWSLRVPVDGAPEPPGDGHDAAERRGRSGRAN